jgi:hypothetical protein
MLFAILATTLALNGKMYLWASERNVNFIQTLDEYTETLAKSFDTDNKNYPVESRERLDYARRQFIVTMSRISKNIALSLDNFIRDLPNEQIDLFIYDEQLSFSEIRKKFKKLADHAIMNAHLQIWRD